MRSHTASHHNARYKAPVAYPLFDDAEGRAAAEGSRAVPSESSFGREAAAFLYLSSGSYCGDSGVIQDEVQAKCTHWVLKPCLCRKWYCGDCAPWMGRKLRHRLRDRLRLFRKVFGITLTIDGSLFSSPEAAWRYVMDNRLLSQLVKKLHKAGFLSSRAYFWVVEWQEETQQAHWHLLVDSDFIPFGKIVEIWSSFRPKWAPSLPVKVTAENYKTLDRPAFGSVRFTLTGCRDAWRASAYTTKYLIKTPVGGYPDWVLDYVGRVPRYGHSRGFFPDGRPPDPKASQRKPSFDPKLLEREAKTLRERVAQCRQQTTVLRVEVSIDETGERIEGRPRFRKTFKVPFHEACAELGVSVDGRRAVRVEIQGLLKVWSLQDRLLVASAPTTEVMEDDW